jgi:hypothetical protein
MDAAKLAIIIVSVFAIPKIYPFRGDICKIFYWNLTYENTIRKEIGQKWSAHLCGIFL